MGRAVSPPCCSIWGQTTVEVLKTMVTSFKRSMHTLLHSVPWPFSRLPLTHASTGDSWTLTGKFGPVSWGITAPLSWVLVHKRFCVCPPRPWVMLKIHQARLRQYMNHALSDVQAGFRKDRGTRDQITNICWIIKKGRKLQKNIYFCFIDYTKAFDCVDHNKLENSSTDGIQDHLTCLLRNLNAGQEATVRTGHGKTDWFQIGKGVCQSCILSLCLFNLYAAYIMRVPAWMKHKLESRFFGEISITSDIQMTTPLCQKAKKN